MKSEEKWGLIAILSVKWQRLPSEIMAMSYGERIFMYTSLKFMYDLEEAANKKM